MKLSYNVAITLMAILEFKICEDIWKICDDSVLKIEKNQFIASFRLE